MAQARRSLDDQLDQVRAQLNHLDDALRAAADRAHPPAPGSKEVVVAGHLARLQRLSAQTLRTALDEARDAGVTWDTLGTVVGVAPESLQAPHVDGPPLNIAPATAGDAGGPKASGVLQVLERQLAAASLHAQEAFADYQTLAALRDQHAADPAISGRITAHLGLTHTRWTEALAARAQLEAVYQELAGQPSPQHRHDASVLREMGVPPNRVGLDGRHPATTRFLQQHAHAREAEGTPPQRRRQPGLEL